MNRVLSIEQSQSCTGQSEYVTKRLCISIVFSIGFLCVLGGYLLGRLSAERHFNLSHALFKELSEQAEALVKKAEQRSKEVLNNSSQIERKLLETFRCDPLPKDYFHLNVSSIGDYVRSILLFIDEKLLKSIEIATISVESL